MNYEPIVVGTQSKGFASTKASDNAGQARKETEPVKDYILLPLWTNDLPFSQDLKSSQDDGFKPSSNELPFDPNMLALEDVGTFDFSNKDEDDDNASTPMEAQKHLLNDKDGKEVDVHMYRLMIGSLMYLTSSRPDIVFACKKQTVVANSTKKLNMWLLQVDVDKCFGFRINYLIIVTTTGTRVKTVSESYYCQYKEVTTAQVEVSNAQELQRKMLSVYY
nr:uncharacterized mitochondrial protein AtMg00810-like [Tanacetum cinerariifolium]